jgi:hypothetical protein
MGAVTPAKLQRASFYCVKKKYRYKKYKKYNPFGLSFFSFSEIETVTTYVHRIIIFYKTSIPKYEHNPSPTALANMTMAALRKTTLIVYCFSP